MIIVENKGINTINIPKNSLSNIKYSGGNVDLSDYYTKEEVDELIDNVEVDLTNYYTKEQVDELIASSKIPYLYVVEENGVYNYSEGSDYDGVLNAIVDNKPYFIYVPSTLGYYSIPTDISRDFGQINANVFAHTNSSVHYYIRYTLTSDNISVTEEKIEYATYDDLVNMGVYGLVVNYIEEYNDYTYNGVDFYTLKQAIESGNKLYSIYLPSSDNTYKIAAQEIVVNDNEIRCITIENNGDTQITTNWVIRFDDDYFEMYITKGNSTTINIATQEWIEGQGFLTSIPDEYVTETELTAKNYATKSEIPTIPTNVSSFNNDSGYITNSALTGYATETYVSDNYQVKGDYLTSVPDEYVTDTELTNKNYVTQQWIEEQGYLTEIPSEYVTESELEVELEKIDTSIPTITIKENGATYEGDMEGVINAIINKKNCNVLWLNGNSLIKAVTTWTTASSNVVRVVFVFWSDNKASRKSFDILKTSPYTITASATIETETAPHIIVDYDNETYEGDLQGVIDAMKNGEEYFIYATMDTHIYLATQNVVVEDRFAIYWFRLSASRTQRVGIVFDYNGNFVSKSTTYANVPVNNLTSTETTKPLSANQGRVLKGLIDTNTTNITNLTNTIGDINNALETIIG